MNKVIDKGFRTCRFVSTIVKHPVLFIYLAEQSKYMSSVLTTFKISFVA